MVRSLVECGWYVNEVDVEGRTPLHCAAENGHDPVVQVLLANEQLDVNARDHRKSTALHEAAWKGYGCTPLWYATRHGHYNVALKLLEESNVIVNTVCRLQTQPEKSTSLHHAVNCNATQTVQRLLARTALNPNVTDDCGRTPLSCASRAGNLPMVELLLSRSDVRVNSAEQNEQPPLWSAASQGHIQVVERLLQCGDIEVNQGWGPYSSPLLAAITRGHSGVAMRLLNCVPRPDVNARTYLGDSALSLTAREGHVDVVARLLEDWQTDRNGADRQGRTALWWAARAGQAQIVQRLLEDDRVLIDVMDNDGVDAMGAARSYYHFEVVQAVEYVRNQILQILQEKVARAVMAPSQSRVKQEQLRKRRNNLLRRINDFWLLYAIRSWVILEMPNRQIYTYQSHPYLPAPTAKELVGHAYESENDFQFYANPASTQVIDTF
ncbi:hypothetical protein CBS115989_9363 [Aspergillus niger]|nr:hypothetical protein CBS115989_9363 [Aspergillus niger]KAI2823741.1 hypothetical protein CBS133816_9030 [Aspergillus niger]KAI2847844.1 hypothetical protein CBS11232_7040 [Aspergillus niger]KAI2854335.1 hypothetical protein CBS12448_7742 [Aspergillus niger]KAI2870648.1 hypothetical protein CBS115988_9172 [Aspergillus niger]